MVERRRRLGPADDSELRTLFNTPHNGVDPSKLEVDSVKAVWSKYFQEFKYSNFAPLFFRGKARAYNTGSSLDGHRKSMCSNNFFYYYCCCPTSNTPLFPLSFAGSQDAKQKAAGRVNWP
jgi:hypothetical protein